MMRLPVKDSCITLPSGGLFGLDGGAGAAAFAAVNGDGNGAQGKNQQGDERQPGSTASIPFTQVRMVREPESS